MVPRAFFAILIAFCVSASARELQQAPSPAATTLPVADLLFILSADQAVFTDATHLKLQNVSSSAQYYGAGAHAGVIPSEDFLNGTVGASYVAADGMWLNAPTATLIGINRDSMQQAVVMSLASPVVDAAAKTVKFNVPAMGQSAIKTSKGVANEAVMETNELMTTVQPGAKLYNAALFVDHNKASMTPPAKTELGGVGGGGFGGTGAGGAGGGGHGGGGVNGAAYARSGNNNEHRDWGNNHDGYNNGWGK